MTTATETGRWPELVMACNPEAVAAVAALFAGRGLNEGVVIEEPTIQDPDTDTVQIDPPRPVTVTTYLDDDGAEETIVSHSL
jgi:hypothetical protein